MALIDEPRLTFASRAEWEQWLRDNHATSSGVWLVLAKKGTGATTITRPDSLEVALCWGWIDGQAASQDETYWQQRYTRRRRRSKWSQVNCEAAERLIANGLMQPAGLAEVDAAKADGRWAAAYAPPSRMTVPADLQQALDANAAASAAFDTLDSQNRYAILHRIQDAKRSETRQRRIEQFVTMLAEGRTLHPPRTRTSKRDTRA